MMRGHRDEINEAFWAFHKAHPEVYAAFDGFVRELLSAGHKRGSAKAIFERIRWDTLIRASDSNKVKVNNNFTSRYARLWEGNNSKHSGFFRTRKLNPASANSVRVPPHETREARV